MVAGTAVLGEDVVGNSQVEGIDTAGMGWREKGLSGGKGDSREAGLSSWGK